VADRRGGNSETVERGEPLMPLAMGEKGEGSTLMCEGRSSLPPFAAALPKKAKNGQKRWLGKSSPSLMCMLH